MEVIRIDKVKDKMIVKFNKVDDKYIEVIYIDGEKEIISINNFNKFSKNNKFKMVLVLPKE